ncbi:GNAT family N-acetyltransferase [uncultured Desulfobulbus sp.]|uniref:GNAT family N-acetyltransferase n=1 Tax=uncultured Desulfobulbus sp. TaxID=239745 RepID=UPI0029C82B5C|nr:GNAT family N-acetyltransferase [uncultured Desulfobulbus sp.]
MNTTVSPFSEDTYSFPPLTLRSLQLSEAGLISTTLAAMDPWKRLGFSASALHCYLIGPDPALNRFTVQDSQETVGVVCMRSPWLRGPYLELLAVFPTAQGRKIGQTILYWIEKQALLTSNNIWAVTSEFNTRARRFYRAANFVEIAPLKNLVANGYNEILLRKVLEQTAPDDSN